MNFLYTLHIRFSDPKTGFFIPQSESGHINRPHPSQATEISRAHLPHPAVRRPRTHCTFREQIPCTRSRSPYCTNRTLSSGSRSEHNRGHRIVPQNHPVKTSRRLIPQKCPTELSRRLIPQTYPAELSRRLIPQNCPADLSHRLIRQTYPADSSRRLIPQTYPAE